MTRMNALLGLALLGLPLDASAEDDCHGTVVVNGVAHTQQCWDAEERHDFYFTSQGSRLMPYSWLLALKQADSDDPFLSGTQGLSRYGYLQDPSGEKRLNPDQLPIGFVKDPPPGSADDTCEYVGMTCAACHTAQLQRAPRAGGPHTLIVDGAPTSADMYDFMTDLGLALLQTAEDEQRLADFTSKLPAGERDGGACQPDLRTALREKAAEMEILRDPPGHPQHEEWGPGRLDAIGIILNQIVRHLDMGEHNLGPVDAPVSYPFIWDIHQHNQVQWNGVSALPLVRNTVEVMGVFAEYGPDLEGVWPFRHYESSVNFPGMYALEDLVTDLRSPEWPEDFFDRKIDLDLAAEGRMIFEAARCDDCHADVHRDQPVPDIRAIMTPLEKIGTDPLTATNFAEREFTERPETESANLKVRDVVGEERVKAACDSPNPSTPQTETVLQTTVPQMFASSFRALLQAAVEALRARFLLDPTSDNRCAYKGRPLDGIWATAPYLHNGSVPNLAELLKPPSDRIARFCVSQIQSTDPNLATFDIEAVGLPSRSECKEGEFLFDTSKRGNGNQGHHYPFVDESTGETRPFTPEEIRALVEYQRSL